MSKQTEALKLALEALEDAKKNHGLVYVTEFCAIKEALAEQPAQQQEIDWEKLYRLEVKKKEALAAKYERDTGKKLTRIVPMAEQPAQQQEPVACPVCNEVHAILDADGSKIIRNAADGYPDGREQRVLTLQERVTALCVYAADWKRWCLEKENTSPPPRKPLLASDIVTMYDENPRSDSEMIAFARAIEAAHGIKGESK